MIKLKIQTKQATKNPNGVNKLDTVDKNLVNEIQIASANRISYKRYW